MFGVVVGVVCWLSAFDACCLLLPWLLLIANV